ncbi:MAG: hypothetical protein ABSG78_19445 [Verrucomicrobiota bacterium]|jgi:hypothetical protein
MRQNIYPELAITAVVIIFIVGVVSLGANLYGRYLRISRGKAAVLLVAAVLLSIGVGFWRGDLINRGHVEPAIQFGDHDFAEAFSIGFAALLPLVAIPFLAKLYLTWIAGAVTDDEKAPGIQGVRAWLRGGNSGCAVLMALCFWFGFGYSFWGSLALALMALLAFPFLNMATATTTAQAPAAPTDALSPERERVLKMLDGGKITASESAELLNALGQSAQPHTAPSAPAPHRKMVLIGLALLLVGFFLPWFVIKTGDVQSAMNNLMSQMPMAQSMPNVSGMMPQGMKVSITGGDIGHGLGWCVLLLGIVAAALPYVAANLDSRTCQKASLITLGAGAIILIYLLTENIRFAGIGLVLGLAGYALEFIGALKARELDWVRAT